MLYGQLALSAFVFAVLLLAGVQNKGYLLLGISVFDPELLQTFAIIHKITYYILYNLSFNTIITC